ncbi:hypothetical protein pb186bvf_009551 [Paramecium bursaria]
MKSFLALLLQFITMKFCTTIIYQFSLSLDLYKQKQWIQNQYEYCVQKLNYG